ncbi:hypothetical protein [Streptomyces sp. NPDC050263]|uniref:hypothetical protein n=1 Tax=Streptomyces sp. NPDC050263 TaxID=3155037 RepID=UPI0034446330
MTFPENPAVLGHPSFHAHARTGTRCGRRAACDTGTVLSVRIGSSGRLAIPSGDRGGGQADRPSLDT